MPDASSPEHTTVKAERAHELRSHLGHLDALRGLAVLAVVSHHAGIIVPNSLTPYINVPGVRGVQLFFILSAFTLLLSSQRRSKDKHPTLFFLLRRFFRLGPLYYLVLVVTVISVPLERSGWGAKWPCLFLMQNLLPKHFGAVSPVFWSLSVEALFYLLFPLLLRWITNLRQALIWLAVSVPATSIAWTSLGQIQPGNLTYWSYNSLLVQFPFFIIGFVCFFLWRDYLQKVNQSETGRLFSSAFLILTGLVLVAVIPIAPLKVLFSSTYVVTFMVAILFHQWRLFVNRFTVFIGKVSYGIYLLHGLLITVSSFRVQVILYRHFDPRWNVLWWLLYYVTLTAVSTGLATITWLFIEEPGIRAGRAFIRRLQHDKPSHKGLFVPARAVLTDTNSPDAQF